MDDPKFIAGIIALIATICCAICGGALFKPPRQKLSEWDKWYFGTLFALVINGLVAVVAGNIALDGVYQSNSVGILSDPNVIAGVVALIATIYCAVIAGLIFKPPLKQLHELDKWFFGSLLALMINGMVAVVAGNIALDGVQEHFTSDTGAFSELKPGVSEAE